MSVDNKSISNILPDSERSIPGGHIPVQSDQLNIGDSVVNNRYKVLSVLGKGGMGIVYKCWDDVSNVEVALKTIAPELSGSSWEMDGIKENFKLVHNLHHPNIAAYNTLERDNSDGIYYLVMEYVDGEDLRYYLRSLRENNNFSEKQVIDIVRQVASALDYAHAHQILHRDIKPGNIMVSRKNEVKILDFGLAAQIHSSLSKVSMQKIDTSGTLPYIAPEQWRGHQAEAASDQYALAATVYEMFATHPPFETSDKDIMRTCVLNDPPRPLKNVSENIQNAVAKALAKNPDDRFASCKEFANALAGIESATQSGQNSSHSSHHEALSAAERKEFYLLRGNMQKLLQNFRRQFPDRKKLSPQIQDIFNRAENAVNGAMTPEALMLLKSNSDKELLQGYMVLTQTQAAAREFIQKLQTLKIDLPTDLQELYTIAEQAYKDDDIVVAADFYAQLCPQLQQLCEAEEQKKAEAERIQNEKLKKALDAEQLAKKQTEQCTQALQKLENKELQLTQLHGKRTEQYDKLKNEAVQRQSSNQFDQAREKYAAAEKILDDLIAQASKEAQRAGESQRSNKSDKDNSENRLQVSICQNLLQNIEALEADLSRLGLKTPQHVANLKVKAVNAQTEKNYADAIKFYKSAIDSMNSHISNHNDSNRQDGRKYEYLGLTDIKNKIKELEQKYPQRTVGYNYTINAAQAQENAGKIAKAKELYEEAAELIIQQNQPEKHVHKPNDSSKANEPWDRLKNTTQSGFKAAQDFINNLSSENTNNHQPGIDVNDPVQKFINQVRLPGNLPLNMVLIQPGTFYMGSPDAGFFQKEELGRWNDEERRKLNIEKPFFIGKYPITQREFKAVTGNNPSHFKGLDLPVENVTLYDAYFFCNKLNNTFKNVLPRGWYFTLPTEVQWEYACRAGTSTALNNGKDLTEEEGFCPNLNEVAWYGANSQATTHPVGSKRPNIWGIYDMHGNIWEWTTTKTNHQIENYVIRGGSWYHAARYCRSAARHTFPANVKGEDIGFRVVLTM